MIENSERAIELIKKVLTLEEGDEKIAACEDAVREADLSGDVEIQYYARDSLVKACVFGGKPERAIVAFAWLLATFDKHPGEFSEWSILWKYKWIVGLLCDFPQISRDRIFEMLEDLTERSRQAGYGLRAVYTHRYRIEKFWDNRTAAIEAFQAMQKLPIDDLSNCPACELDEKVDFSIYCDENELAVDLAQPLLNGVEKCRTVPHRTYAKLLLPMVKLGRQQEALNYHRAGYTLAANNKEILDRVSDHLLFLALTENFAEAIELFQKHYVWTEGNRNAADLFHFYRASFFLFDVMADRENNSVTLKLPKSFPLHRPNSHYELKRLENWFWREAEARARRFDARNETDFFMRTLNETPSLKKLCAPFPFEE